MVLALSKLIMGSDVSARLLGRKVQFSLRQLVCLRAILGLFNRILDCSVTAAVGVGRCSCVLHNEQCCVVKVGTLGLNNF